MPGTHGRNPSGWRPVPAPISASSFTAAGEARDGASLLLGRPPATAFPAGDRRRADLGRRGRCWRREIVVERLPGRGIAATRCETSYLENAHTRIKRDRHDVAGTHRLRRSLDPRAVDP